MPNVPFAPLFIDGECRPASAGATFQVHSPHTGALASTAAAASSEDCRAAIAAAQRAFPAWEDVAFATRRDILLRAAATLKSEEWQKKAAPAMQAEVAMSRMHALFNFVAGFELLASVAGLANDLKGLTLPSTVPGGHVFIQRRAQGVVYVLVFPPHHPSLIEKLSSWLSLTRLQLLGSPVECSSPTYDLLHGHAHHLWQHCGGSAFGILPVHFLPCRGSSTRRMCEELRMGPFSLLMWTLGWPSRGRCQFRAHVR